MLREIIEAKAESSHRGTAAIHSAPAGQHDPELEQSRKEPPDTNHSVSGGFFSAILLASGRSSSMSMSKTQAGYLP